MGDYSIISPNVHAGNSTEKFRRKRLKKKLGVLIFDRGSV